MQEAALAGVVVLGAIAVFLAGLAVGMVLATFFVKRRRDRRHSLHREPPGRPPRSARSVRRSDLSATMPRPDGGLSH